MNPLQEKKNKDKLQLIANTILDQIVHQNKLAMLTFGSHNIQPMDINKERQGGLMFSVEGRNHKGVVCIALTYKDDYTITYERYRTVEGVKTWVIDRKVEGLFYDNLVEELLWIEKFPKKRNNLALSKGDLVELKDNRIGIIVRYASKTDIGLSIPVGEGDKKTYYAKVTKDEIRKKLQSTNIS